MPVSKRVNSLYTVKHVVDSTDLTTDAAISVVENWEFYAMGGRGEGGGGRKSVSDWSRIQDGGWNTATWLANFKLVCDWTIIQDGGWKITGPGWIKWINLIGQYSNLNFSLMQD